MLERRTETEVTPVTRFAVYELIEGEVQLHLLSLREIAARSKQLSCSVWSGRLSTGVFGSPHCEVGNKGPKGSDQIVLGLGDAGLRSFVSAGFVPCPVCKPEQTFGFWEAAGIAVQEKWNLSSPDEFADKTNVPYDPRNLPWEKLFEVIEKFPDRLYLPKQMKTVDVEEFDERLTLLSDQTPELGFYDRNSSESGHFTQFSIK
jgi:hypothetical protein